MTYAITQYLSKSTNCPCVCVICRKLFDQRHENCLRSNMTYDMKPKRLGLYIERYTPRQKKKKIKHLNAVVLIKNRKKFCKKIFHLLNSNFNVLSQKNIISICRNLTFIKFHK